MPLKPRFADRVTSCLSGGHLKYYMLVALMFILQFCWNYDISLQGKKIHVSCQIILVGMWSCEEWNM
jgi:hypothetical protein